MSLTPDQALSLLYKHHTVVLTVRDGDAAFVKAGAVKAVQAAYLQAVDDVLSLCKHTYKTYGSLGDVEEKIESLKKEAASG